MEVLIWIIFLIIFLALIGKVFGSTDSKQSKRKVYKDDELSQYGISITMGRSGGQDRLAEWNKKRDSLENAFKEGRWQVYVDLFHRPELSNYLSWYDNEHLAIAYLMLGEDGQSRDVVRSSFDRRNSQAKKYPMVELAEAYLNLDRFEEAIHTIQNGDLVLMKEGSNKDLYYRALIIGAKAFMGLQRFNEAINWLKQGPLRNKTLTLGIADLFEVIAVCYVQVGDLPKALNAYQKVLSVRFEKGIQMKILELEESIELFRIDKDNNWKNKRSN